jgi:6-phosphogluconolactonase
MQANTRASLPLIPTASFAAFAALALGACVDGGEPEDTTEAVEQDIVTGGGTGRLDVFVMDNSDVKNRVIAFHRETSGALTRVAAFPTGGTGTSAGLGSQGSIVLDATRRHLFVANAGSNEVSVFEVSGSGLILRDIVRSGGQNPISLTVHDDLLYVLNAGRDGAAGKIAGFRLGDESMTPIAGSQRLLSGPSVGPAQIQFSPTGDVLVVTEKATNNITTYRVDAMGRASNPIVTASNGQTPFGFTFDRHGTLIVSEAFGGAPGASAVSSYALGPDGVPTLISGSVPSGQSAACWVAIGTRPYAYTTNTASDNISGYRVTAAGVITLLGDGGVTATTAAGPLDADFTATGGFLYVLDGGGDAIDGFVQDASGALMPVDRITGLPAASVGLAAR